MKMKNVSVDRQYRSTNFRFKTEGLYKIKCNYIKMWCKSVQKMQWTRCTG